jgi:NADH dehydrogenase/NADH:ubiquinone oxidoreductase subunit G
MFDRKKPLEEKIGAAIEAEFEGLVAELERDLGDYRRRSRIKEKAQFWEAYYGNDKATLSKIERRHRSLRRATKRAEKSLRRAHENFEKADFDEAAEGAALKKKAYAAAEKVDLRIGALEEAVEELLAEKWRNIKELSTALRDEGEGPRFSGTEEEETDHRRSA